MTTKARLDADRTAEPRTRLVAKVPPTDCYSGGATHYEGEDGTRVALTEHTKRNGPSALLAAVHSALRAIGCDPALVREDPDGRLWLGDWSVKEDAPGEVEVRLRRGHLFMPAATRKQAAVAIVREWVREQLDAWVQDDGDGE